MARPLSLLLALAVLLGGMHVGEAAHAHESEALHALELGPGSPDAAAPATHADTRIDGEASAPNDAPDDSTEPQSTIHHHCQAALDLGDGAGLQGYVSRAVRLAALPAAPLASLTRAPPLQPPSA